MLCMRYDVPTLISRNDRCTSVVYNSNSSGRDDHAPLPVGPAVFRGEGIWRLAPMFEYAILVPA